MSVVKECQAWLSDNWDPDLTVRDWWKLLGLSGWAAPTLPADCFGKGLSASEGAQVARTIREHGALTAPGGLGPLLAAPTILRYGTDEQKSRLIRRIVTGRDYWCQLFSEPEAGSDLAGVRTTAKRDGTGYRISGQKIWTSGGRIADRGMLIARTDPALRKQSGITYFALDMNQPGVDVRPLREMTGRALFNEVFIDDAFVDSGDVIGEVNSGWAVAKATLAFERSGLGSGNSVSSKATPGSIAGDLDRRAGDVADRLTKRAIGGPDGLARAKELIPILAAATGRSTDPVVRQQLVDMYIRNKISSCLIRRDKDLQSQGRSIPGIGNILKLSMSDMARITRQLGSSILGVRAQLHSYSEDHEALKTLDELVGGGSARVATEAILFSNGPSIYGGTDQIQKNILAERVLGLPRD